MNQTVKHTPFTPGPWTALTDDGGSRPHTNIVAVNPRTDCVFSLPGHHKKEPNVQLIAAAPDMLEALRKIDGFWTADFPDGPDGSREWAGGLGNLSDDTVEVWRAIRAAIAKAEGRS